MSLSDRLGTATALSHGNQCDAQSLAQQDAAKAAAIDEQVASKPGVVIEFHGKDMPALPVQLDIHDPPFLTDHAALGRIPAQQCGITRRVEMVGVLHIGQR